MVKALREFGTAHVRMLGVAEETEKPDFGIDLARVVELLPGLAEGMPAIRAVLEEDGLHRQG